MGGAQLEAALPGGVTEDQVGLEPALRGLLEVGAQPAAPFARSFGREHHDALERRSQLDCPGCRLRGDRDQVRSRDDQQVAAGAHRAIGLAEALERAADRLRDEGEEQADQEDEAGDDLEDTDRAGGGALVVLQRGGVEQVEGRPPERFAEALVLVEGELGERRAAQQHDGDRAQQHDEAAAGRLQGPGEHLSRSAASTCGRSRPAT